MPVKQFLDTNILLYAYDLDAGSKREKALSLLSDALRHPSETAISVQVLQEFHVNFTRFGNSPEDAAFLIQDLSTFHVVDNTLSLLRRGLEEKARWQLSLWDAMILAAARYSGASTLLTEDFNPGQNYGDLHAVNPFL
ncbi:MAG: PIN domain-containing protein [Kiritimatiellia bacterium]